MISQIAEPPDSNYIANHLSTETGKILIEKETLTENSKSGDFPLMEHKIEFEKLKEPEDQLAMESVRSNIYDEISEKNISNYMLKIIVSVE